MVHQHQQQQQQQLQPLPLASTKTIQQNNNIIIANAGLSYDDVLNDDFQFDMDGHDVMVFLHIQKTGGTSFGRHLVRDLDLKVSVCIASFLGFFFFVFLLPFLIFLLKTLFIEIKIKNQFHVINVGFKQITAMIIIFIIITMPMDFQVLITSDRSFAGIPIFFQGQLI